MTIHLILVVYLPISVYGLYKPLPLVLLLLFLNIILLLLVLSLFLILHIFLVFYILVQILYDTCIPMLYVLNFLCMNFSYVNISLRIIIWLPPFILYHKGDFYFCYFTHSYKLFSTTCIACGFL